MKPVKHSFNISTKLLTVTLACFRHKWAQVFSRGFSPGRTQPISYRVNQSCRSGPSTALGLTISSESQLIIGEKISRRANFPFLRGEKPFFFNLRGGGDPPLCPAMHYMYTSLEESITKLTFYHIRCFLLSKDAFTPNLTEFGPLTRARATNLASNQSRIEILRVRKKLQNRQKLMTFWIDLNLWHPESLIFFFNFQNRSTFTIQRADFKFGVNASFDSRKHLIW